MNITTEMASKSLNHVGEILCGDRVQMVHRADSDILVLADGMGSGVRANMLSTLTSQIFGKMLLEGATLEECVETVVDTLPADPRTGASYSTFTVLQIFHDGRGILYEYENPGCIFIRGNQLIRIPKHEEDISGKRINTYRFTAQIGDTFLIMSDFRQRRNKRGEEYGWHVAELMTPETKWGYDAVNGCNESPEESWCRIMGQIRKYYPKTDDRAVQKVLGIRK